MTLLTTLTWPFLAADYSSLSTAIFFILILAVFLESWQFALRLLFLANKQVMISSFKCFSSMFYAIVTSNSNLRILFFKESKRWSLSKIACPCLQILSSIHELSCFRWAISIFFDKISYSSQTIFWLFNKIIFSSLTTFSFFNKASFSNRTTFLSFISPSKKELSIFFFSIYFLSNSSIFLLITFLLQQSMSIDISKIEPTTSNT